MTSNDDTATGPYLELDPQVLAAEAADDPSPFYEDAAVWTAPDPAGLPELNGSHDPRPDRAFSLILALALNGRDGDEISARALTVLRDDPDGDGTPLRCERCTEVYRIWDGAPKLEIAGAVRGLCYSCGTRTDPGDIAAGNLPAKLAIEAPKDGIVLSPSERTATRR